MLDGYGFAAVGGGFTQVMLIGDELVNVTAGWDDRWLGGGAPGALSATAWE
jgi:hypothetical protein